MLHLLRHGRCVWGVESFVPGVLRHRQDSGGSGATVVPP